MIGCPLDSGRSPWSGCPQCDPRGRGGSAANQPASGTVGRKWQYPLSPDSAIEMGIPRRKRAGHLDEVAAAVILQSYLDSLSHSQITPKFI